MKLSKQERRPAQLWLEVKFIDKEAVRNRGGRWCSIKKKWYVPFGLDINDFINWFPSELKRGVELFEKREVAMLVKHQKKKRQFKKICKQKGRWRNGLQKHD